MNPIDPRSSRGRDLHPADQEAITRALDRLFAQPPPPLTDRQKTIIERAFRDAPVVSRKAS